VDDFSIDNPEFIYERFPLISSLDEAAFLFTKNTKFSIGVGNPKIRKELMDKMRSIGGEIVTSYLKILKLPTLIL
jgi:hypothetical protein